MEPTPITIVPPNAPTLESCGNNYEVYAKAYSTYLAIATEYNRQVKSRTERPGDIPQVAGPQIHVTFANQDSRQTVGDITTPSPFKYMDRDSRAGKVRFSDSASRTPTSLSVINMIEARDKREAISERLAYLSANYPKVEGHKPTIDEIASGLRDVMTIGAIDDMITRKRVPKSYRSLQNLREMGLRVKQNSSKVLLDAGDLKCLN